jgi:hypothetical protein
MKGGESTRQNAYFIALLNSLIGKEDKMAKIKWMFFASLVILLTAALLLPASVQAEKKLYIGGTQSLTGPFAEDSAAVLAAIEDYVKYVNETKNMAPWREEKFPADIKLEVMWRDDELKPPKALSIFEELKAKGMLVARISGSPIALALKDRLWEDQMGATSMATGSYLLTPPQSIFTYYPIYTDSLASIADWFKANWKEARKPRVAYRRPVCAARAYLAANHPAYMAQEKGC